MIKSMTGFGRYEFVEDNATYTVEVKSVNHRYFEFSCRVPRGLSFLEEKLKSFFAKNIARGKVEVYVELRSDLVGNTTVKLNEGLAEQYIGALKQLKKRFALPGKISVDLVAKNNELFTTVKEKIDEETVWQNVQKAAEGALQAFVAMRQDEGARLVADVESRCQKILSLVEKIEQRSPETVEAYRNRLAEKMQELLQDRQIDEQRLLTETAIFADKVAVDEETVRLRSHITQLTQMLHSDEVVGRKLDFVVQEMNREANTTGSKCVDIEISHMVVDIKAEIEKIREQIQNIE